MATMWREAWAPGKAAVSTSTAGERELISTCDGVAERATRTAENVATALACLVETLHEQGRLTDTEVKHILDLHGYEAVDD